MPATSRKGIAWAPSDDALLEAARDSLPAREGGWTMAAVIRIALRALPAASARVRHAAAEQETRKPGPEPRQ